MATATRPVESEPAALDGIVPYRVTVEQFLGMIEAGVFGESDRVELLGGVLADKMTKHDPHDFTTGRLARLLRVMAEPEFVVREEKSVVLGPYWRPEPDVALAVGPDDLYKARAPRAADLVLVAEVADSSRLTDRSVKWRGYAGAGVPAYWLVDIPARSVEVFTDPAGEGETAGYRGSAVYRLDGEIPLVIAGREFGKIAVNDVMP